jgi:Reverse transcriptase (RNA-dependent DNA polymerase)
MQSNQLWNQLLEPTNLKAGWHLTRAELRKDFAERLLIEDAFALDLDGQIKELLRQLSTETFEPRPIIKVDVPKSNLAVRPGSILHIEDRVVLYSAIRLIASKVDANFSECVYSYRAKKGKNDKSLFHENDVLDIPFLKTKTIRRLVEPFDPWYELWPAFDDESRQVFEDDDYKFLVVSDISAYFENIQLNLLRDQLLKLIPEETKIVNLFHRCLSAWVVKSQDGYNPPRGIPQGNQFSSFLGNLFLLPVDERLIEFAARNDCRYFRYMDDIRLFCKTFETARRAVFELDSVIRQLHLNIQSAKTKILDENRKEISTALIDPRMPKLDKIDEQIKSFLKNKNHPLASKKKILEDLKKVAAFKPALGEQKILGARKPLKGLSLRVFRRWMNGHSQVGSVAYASQLFTQIRLTPDHRLTRKLEILIKQSPRSRSYAKELELFLGSEFNIFSHQHAEIIRALRFCDTISADLKLKALEWVVDQKHFNPYVRAQSCYLLGRTQITTRQRKALWKTWEKERDEDVLCALSFVLCQCVGDHNREFVRRFLLHPNRAVSSIGRMLRLVKNDKTEASAQLNYIFLKHAEFRVFESLPLLYCIVSSADNEIKANFIKMARTLSLSHYSVDIRDILKKLMVDARY